MGAEQRPEDDIVDRFVAMSGRIPRGRDERIQELIRLRLAHFHLPLPETYIDHELTPEMISNERENIQALSYKELARQIQKERRRLRIEAYVQHPHGSTMP